MFRTVKDFLRVWEYESGSTRRVFDHLTDESLGQRIAPGYRSLGELAWHITGAVGKIARHTGLDIPGPDDKREPVPPAADIATAYTRAAGALAAGVESWTDETLFVKDMVYGYEWRRRVTLQVLLFHEIHHRGQMTVLMRQAGLGVPGLYGDTKPGEE
jgi:uncharacterized damage-inducible protein DinB